MDKDKAVNNPCCVHQSHWPTSVVFFLAALFIAPTTSRAEPSHAKNPPGDVNTDHPRERLDLEFHLWFLGATTLAWGALEVVKYTAGPTHCRWCDKNARGASTLNRLDRQLRSTLRAPKSRQHHVKRASDALAFAIVPLSGAASAFLFAFDTATKARKQKGAHPGKDRLFSSRSFWRQAAENSILMAEAAAMASLIYQVAALSAARQRPYAHFSVTPDEKPWNNISFFSGHTTLAFSLTTAAGTIAQLRGYKWSGWVWALGIPAALATGALRIAADQHYFTDVLTGALLGSLVGFAVPALSLRRGLVPTLAVDTKSAHVGVGGRF